MAEVKDPWNGSRNVIHRLEDEVNVCTDFDGMEKDEKGYQVFQRKVHLEVCPKNEKVFAISHCKWYC